jgi:glycosyltransferase involved in cell wall biosynthesis
MMLGTPVIATDVGGNSELIENGVTGLLIPLDEEALLAAIKNIQNDPAAARTRAATARKHMEKFSTDAMLSATSSLLTKI